MAGPQRANAIPLQSRPPDWPVTAGDRSANLWRHGKATAQSVGDRCDYRRDIFHAQLPDSDPLRKRQDGILEDRAAGGRRRRGRADRHCAPRATIRIATFHLGRFDEAKLANRRVSDVLVRLLPRFDLVAVQGVRGKNRGVLIRLVEQLNAAGPSAAVTTSPPAPAQPATACEHYNAFLFDRNRIDVDRTTRPFCRGSAGAFSDEAAGGLVSRPRAGPGRGVHVRAYQRRDRPRAARPRSWTCWPPPIVRSARAAAAKTTSSCWATWRATTSTWAIEQTVRRVSPLLSGLPSTVRGTQLLDNVLAGSPRHPRVHRPGRGGRPAPRFRVDRCRAPRKSPSTCPSGPSSAPTKAASQASPTNAIAHVASCVQPAKRRLL